MENHPESSWRDHAPSALARGVCLAACLLILRLLAFRFAVLPNEVELSLGLGCLALISRRWPAGVWIAGVITVLLGDLLLSQLGWQTIFRLCGVLGFLGVLQRFRSGFFPLTVGMAAILHAIWCSIGMEIRGVYPFYYALAWQAIFDSVLCLLIAVVGPKAWGIEPSLEAEDGITKRGVERDEDGNSKEPGALNPGENKFGMMAAVFGEIPFTAVGGFLISRMTYDYAMIRRGYASSFWTEIFVFLMLLVIFVMMLYRPSTHKRDPQLAAPGFGLSGIDRV